jgi:cell division protein FtsN
VVALASFLCGYFAATVFDFASLSSWINKNVLNHSNAEPKTQVAAKPVELPKPKFEFYTLLSKDHGSLVPVNRPMPTTAMKGQAQQTQVTQQPAAVSNSAAVPTQASAPTQGSVPTQSVARTATQKVGQAVAVTESRPVTNTNKMPVKGSYQIQVASFNRRADAEHLKASLVMRGFDVGIVPVNQRNMTWFRVIVGPFGSRVDADKAQAMITRVEHMKGIVSMRPRTG